jgi:phage baseplate assembly protein gpV
MNAPTNRSILFAAALSLLLFAFGPVGAADIDRTVALQPGGSVSIEIPLGTLEVEAWDRAEVQITGTYTGDPERLRIDAGDGEVHVELDLRPDDRARADLRIRVPRLAELRVEALSCDVAMTGLEAEEVDLEIVDGDVRFDGVATSLEVESVSGEVVVAGRIDAIEVESAAGDVRVDAAVRTVSVESAAGNVDVTGSAPFEEIALSTVSGNVRITGGLSANGELDVETLNGNTELWLDPGTAATARVDTFNGTIDVLWDGVEIGGPSAEQTPDRDAGDHDHARPHHRGRSERFVLGSGGGAKIRVETFNGSCTIRQR